MMRRFLMGPVMAAFILTNACLSAQVFHIQVVMHTLWSISAPALVASIHSLSFIERSMPALYGILLPYHAAVRAVAYFIASMFWTAFVSLPFWSSFRIGSLSALGTEIIILVIAVVITFFAFAFMFATFPHPS